MLESLEAKNFQSHKSSKVSLHPKINIFTGQSDSGKTSLSMRAFELLRKNRPRGLAFKTHNSKKPTEVAATFDGITARRIRSKTINQYKLGDEIYDVVGSDVPEEIANFLNISDNTIQSQHEDYFLLQTSPGEVAKKLNKVANLEIIDFVTKEVNSEITGNTKSITTSENTIKETEENLQEYKHLDKAEELINTISDQIQKQEEAEEECEQLTTTISTIKETEEDLKGLEEWLEIEDEVLPIVEMVNELKEVQIEEQELKTTIDSITQLEQRIQTLSAFIGREEAVNDILGYIEEYNELVVELRALQKLILNININTDIILGKEEEISELTEQAVALIKENEMCPLCGGGINKKTIAHIKNWL